IFSRLLWQNPSPHKLRAKLERSLGKSQARQPGEDSEPTLGGFRIAGRCLAEHKLGNDEVEVVPTLLPPVYSNLLVRSDNDRSARARRREVADDRGFQIDATPHAISLPQIGAFSLPVSTNHDLWSAMPRYLSAGRSTRSSTSGSGSAASPSASKGERRR